MAIIRGHHDFDDHFTRIPNAWLRDEKLSLEARGLLAQIMSHRPGWNMSLRSLAFANGVGRDRIKRIVDELLEAGYLERSEAQGKDEKGRMQSYDYTTRSPEWSQKWTQNPYTGEPYTDEPDTESGSTKKTKPKKTNEIEQHVLEGFNEFWKIYPKKKDKPRATRCFESALKRVSLQTIIDGATRYRDDPNREDKYTKDPTTWLNNDAWDNPPEPPKQQPRRANWEDAADLARKYREEETAAIEYENKETAEAIEAEAITWLKGVDDD